MPMVPETEVVSVVVVTENDVVGTEIFGVTTAGAIGRRDTTTSDVTGPTVVGTWVFEAFFTLVRFRTVVGRVAFFDVFGTERPTKVLETALADRVDVVDLVDRTGTGRAVVTGETANQAEIASPTMVTTRRFMAPRLGDLYAIPSAIRMRVL
jgi:hypothetical protein